MLQILSITLPVFAVIALGYGTTRARLFNAQDMRVFGRFVMNIALPALLFNALAKRDFAEVFNSSYLAVYAGAAVLMIGVAMVWFRTVAGLGTTRAAICTLGTACPNSGYMAYPILILAFPDVAGVALALNMMVENLVVVPICLSLMALGRGSTAGSLGRVLRAVLMDLVRRPLLISLVAGLLFSLSGLHMPAVLDRLTGFVAMAASPLALFVIGGTLVGLPIRGARLLAAQIVAGKLLVHPALMVGALLVVPLIGFAPLSGEMRAALMITATVPMLGVYPIFAQEDGQEGVASIALMGATLASFLSISLTLAVLG